MGKYAVIIVSAVIFSMLMYSSALRNALFMSNTRTVQSHGINQAQNIAQSALMVAINDAREDINSIFNPNKDNSYNYPSQNTFADWDDLSGSYNIVAKNHGDTLLTLQSTGKFFGSTYRATVGLSYATGDWSPIIDQAVHAEDKIHLVGNAIIGGDATINSIESNAVQLGSSTSIDSTLYIGPEGNPDVVVNNKNKVGNGVYNLEKELEYPLPIFPAFPPSSMTGSSIYTTQTISPSDYEDYYIPEIYLTGGAELSIETGGIERELHVGRFDIQSGNVHIDGGGSLKIYVEDEVDLNGHSTVNEFGDINDLVLFYKGDETVDLGDDSVELGGNTLFNGSFFSKEATVVLNGTSGIQGNIVTGGLDVTIKGDAEALSRTVYAPHATVSLDGTARIRGSVVSDEFNAQGNATIIYEKDLDAEFPDLDLNEGALSVLYWN